MAFDAIRTRVSAAGQPRRPVAVAANVDPRHEDVGRLGTTARFVAIFALHHIVRRVTETAARQPAIGNFRRLHSEIACEKNVVRAFRRLQMAIATMTDQDVKMLAFFKRR